MSSPKVRCSCGQALSRPEVVLEPVYTSLGWLMFLIGVTAKPRVVLTRCLWCRKVLARTRDPKVLVKFD